MSDTMKPLPEAVIYDQSIDYWPYKLSLSCVIDRVVQDVPRNATVIDVMCGTGYVLGEIAKRRPDLTLRGVDIDERYIYYGRETYPGVTFEQGDVLQWQPEAQANVVICTGALHHIPYAEQGAAIANIASMVRRDGFVVISDCYVGNYCDETKRKLAAARLGYEYLVATIKNGAPDEVIAWTTEILWNDVFGHEFKPSLAMRLRLINRHFRTVIAIKAWPEQESEYGDYVHICHLG